MRIQPAIDVLAAWAPALVPAKFKELCIFVADSEIKLHSSVDLYRTEQIITCMKAFLS